MCIYIGQAVRQRAGPAQRGLEQDPGTLRLLRDAGRLEVPPLGLVPAQRGGPGEVREAHAALLQGPGQPQSLAERLTHDTEMITHTSI